MKQSKVTDRQQGSALRSATPSASPGATLRPPSYGIEWADRQAPARGGAPLPSWLGSRLTQAFGADLSRVRIHTDEAAATATAAVSARAFTIGQDIYFGRNLFDPWSTRGQRLIAHEVAHTRQTTTGPQSPSSSSRPGDLVEREADAAAHAFVMGGAIPKLSAAPAGVLLREAADSAHAEPEGLAGMSFSDKLLRATFLSLSEIFNQEALLELAGAAALFVALNFTGLGQIAIVVYLLRGALIVTVVNELFEFFDGVDTARNDEDLRQAGAHLARVVRLVGLGALIGAFRAKSGGGTARSGPGLLTRAGRSISRAYGAVRRGIAGAYESVRQRIAPGSAAAKDPLDVDPFAATQPDALAPTLPATSPVNAQPAPATGRPSSLAEQLTREVGALHNDEQALDLLFKNWSFKALTLFRNWRYVEAFFRLTKVSVKDQRFVREVMAQIAVDDQALSSPKVTKAPAYLRQLLRDAIDLGLDGPRSSVAKRLSSSK